MQSKIDSLKYVYFIYLQSYRLMPDNWYGFNIEYIFLLNDTLKFSTAVHIYCEAQ